MQRHAGELTLIIVGIVAATPVWADIPSGAFDLPTVTSAKKSGERPNRPSKLNARKPSPNKHSLRQPAPHKVMGQHKQPSRMVARQTEQKKTAPTTQQTEISGKPVLARAGAALSHYLPKFKQDISRALGAVKQQGTVIQSTTLKAWQGVKLWMESKKENLHVSQP